MRTSRGTRLRRLGAAVLAAAVAGLGLGGASAGAASAPEAPAPKPIDLQILSFNDYHGHLSPPTGDDGLLTTAAGPYRPGASSTSRPT